MDALEKLRGAYQDRERPARSVHELGGKVVGYFSNNVPVELIAAAGMFAVRLTGSPEHATELGDRYMEEFHDGEIRSIFDRILRGLFNFADLIVVPRTSESFLQLYYYLLEVRRWEPERPFPEIYLFDLLHAPGETVARYDRGRLEDLRTRLAALGGRTIDDQALRAAIEAINENRALLTQVNELRRRDPPLLSGTDMLRLYGTASFVATDFHSACLREIAANAETRPPVKGARLMVKGSPHEDDRFYALVESCGAVIVADDHTSGERAFEHPVAEQGDPMAALTEHYHRHSPSPRSYPQEEQDRRFIELVEAAKVQGVIFYHDEWDDVLGWDYPEQKKLLDARGIPSIYLKKQSYRAPDRAAQRDAVLSLVRTIT
jgi:benzoyl-CoA reductase/2-hydroxyglutaryl-CoA dehydratase subunit BcrC/BadD/HgdB